MRSPSAVVRKHARRHGVAAFLVAALLLGGAGAAQIEDGVMPPPAQREVLSALASDAGSGIEVERLRPTSSRGPQLGTDGPLVGPPV